MHTTGDKSSIEEEKTKESAETPAGGKPEVRQFYDPKGREVLWGNNKGSVLRGRAFTIIKDSAMLRNNYSNISALCKETGEPVYLTENGEGDLAVMDIVAFERRENMFKPNHERQKVREARLEGEVGYAMDETVERMQESIKETVNTEV